MNLFNLVATLTLSSAAYNKGLDDAEKKGTSFASRVGSVLKGAAVGITGLMTAATAGITKLTKAAVSEYASYEQLVGGVETLFKGAADTVLKNADIAYKTAGVSANKYMETVTSFSASLIQGLKGDTAEAARVANMALIDMSDNANKMGTDMEAIQNAYQGFAKQNFTMLDNLKLGYGGTASEMARLVNESGVLGAAAEEVTAKNLKETVSFAQMVEAIHIVQERMGITGTTALEAATTVEGSVNSMKAAWTNLLVSFAQGTDQTAQRMDELVQAISTTFGNIYPVIERVLVSVSNALPQAAQIIIQRLPATVGTILPQLVSAAATLVDGVIAALPALLQALGPAAANGITVIIQALLARLPDILKTAMQLVLTLANGISATLPQLIPLAVQAVVDFTQTLLSNADKVVDAGIKLIKGLAQGLLNAIPNIIAAVPQLISSLLMALASNIPQLIKAGFELLVSLITHWPQALDQIIAQVPAIIWAIVKGLAAGIVELNRVGVQLLQGLWEGIASGITWLKDKVVGVAKSVIGWFKGIFGISSPSKVFAEFGRYIDEGLGKGLKENADSALKPLRDIADEMNGLQVSPSVNMTANGAQGEAGIGGRWGAVTININGANKDPEEIAREVSRVFNQWTDQKEATAFA